MELNITRPFLETMMDVIEVWKDDSFAEENAKSIEYHPYFIKNETGQVQSELIMGDVALTPPILCRLCIIGCQITNQLCIR